MPLIVEDGSIVPGANGYISVAELKAYWADRNHTFTQDDPTLEGAIVVSTQHVDLNNNFKGSIVSDSQSLEWPRSGVIDGRGREIPPDEIPQQLKNAVCEYAKRNAEGTDLDPDDEGKGQVKREKFVVDVLEEETEYTENTHGIVSFPAADKWLDGLTTSGGSLGNFGVVGNC